MRPLTTRPQRIVYVCHDFRRIGLTDAIRKEAKGLLDSAQEREIVSRMISIESDAAERTEDPCLNTTFIPPAGFGRELQLYHPTVIHAFESSLGPYFFELPELQRYPTVMTIVGSRPVDGLHEDHLDELRHMTDAGMLRVVVESEYARQQCVAAGLHSVELIYPCVFDRHLKKNLGDRTGKQFAVGFASSPLEPDNYKPRGVHLIAQLAREMPDVLFRIAWRDKSVPLQDNFNSLPNVEIIYGAIDMAHYYENIDAMMLPFTSRERTHTCPFSAIEGFRFEKPVIATDLVGCHDVFRDGGFGVVTEATVTALAAGIRTVSSSLEKYRSQIRANFGQYFDSAGQTKRYHEIYESLQRQRQFWSLHLWNSALEAEGKKLVRGRDALREYYQQSEVAESYTAVRFTAPMLKLYNELEQAAVDLIIKNRYDDMQNLLLADFATGDGRMLPILSTHGTCTAVDSSAAMLSVVKKRLGLKQLNTVEADVFSVTLPAPVDVITLFRFIRHFMYLDRQIIYDVLRRNLKPSGIAIVEFPNMLADCREYVGYEKYPIYDVFWNPEKIQREALENGFAIVAQIPAGEHVLDEVPFPYQSEPLAWITALTPRINTAS